MEGDLINWSRAEGRHEQIPLSDIGARSSSFVPEAEMVQFYDARANNLSTTASAQLSIPGIAARRDGSPRDFGCPAIMAACSRFGQSMAALEKTLHLPTTRTRAEHAQSKWLSRRRGH
jgi:hypothetical protein